jgi:hypothetical protein
MVVTTAFAGKGETGSAGGDHHTDLFASLIAQP